MEVPASGGSRPAEGKSLIGRLRSRPRTQNEQPETLKLTLAEHTPALAYMPLGNSASSRSPALRPMGAFLLARGMLCRPASLPGQLSLYLTSPGKIRLKREVRCAVRWSKLAGPAFFPGTGRKLNNSCVTSFTASRSVAVYIFIAY